MYKSPQGIHKNTRIIYYLINFPFQYKKNRIELNLSSKHTILSSLAVTIRNFPEIRFGVLFPLRDKVLSPGRKLNRV